MPTLDWIGKKKVINHHQEVPFRVLERRYSYDAELQRNEVPMLLFSTIVRVRLKSPLGDFSRTRTKLDHALDYLI